MVNLPESIAGSEPNQPASGEDGSKETNAACDLLAMIDELCAEVPSEELAKLPVDGARQLDHYLNGSPKRSDA